MKFRTQQILDFQFVSGPCNYHTAMVDFPNKNRDFFSKIDNVLGTNNMLWEAIPNFDNSVCKKYFWHPLGSFSQIVFVVSTQVMVFIGARYTIVWAFLIFVGVQGSSSGGNLVLVWWPFFEHRWHVYWYLYIYIYIYIYVVCVCVRVRVCVRERERSWICITTHEFHSTVARQMSALEK